ncbi:MAG: SGNH/GDSL hydrolase family protein [Lutibacter sp.]|nr:SGNH/GDSL hydrolase family protein [Lutibacter sp.]
MKKRSALIVFIMIFSNSSIAQDWANLSYYAAANDSLRSLVAEDRVVFMGNSITESWQEFQPAFFKGKNYINRGISGQTTPQMLLRFRADVIELQPRVVVILAGTNDIAGNTGPISIPTIAGYIFSMATLAKEHNIKVIISSVLPAQEYSWMSEKKHPDVKIPLLNQLLRDYALTNGHGYLDYFSVMKNDTNGLIEAYTYDGVHPNKKGYEQMAVLAEAAIRNFLRRP